MKKPKASKDNTDRIAPSYEKNLTNMKLLVSKPDFQRIIADVRKLLNLPSDGFDLDKEPEKLQEWRAKTYQRSNEMRDSRRFRDHFNVIWEKVKSGKYDATMAQKHRDLLCDQLPENQLANALDRIIEENNLPLNYADSISTYILSNEITAPLYPFSISTQFRTSGRPRSIHVEVYAELTDDDLKTIKKQINGLFPVRPPKSPKPLKNIDAKLMAEEMMRDKERTSSTGESYKITAQEISETLKEEHGVDLKPEQINGIPREMGNLRRRFKNKSVK